jgi:hypothetical protein
MLRCSHTRDGFGDQDGLGLRLNYFTVVRNILIARRIYQRILLSIGDVDYIDMTIRGNVIRWSCLISRCLDTGTYS